MIPDYIRKEELEQLYKEIKINSEDLVLDALCGSGFASKPLVRRVKGIVGIDTKCKPENFPTEIKYSQQSVENLNFPSDFFDLAVAHTGFHHVGDGNKLIQQKAANELYRVLRPGSYLRIADLQGRTKAALMNDAYVPGHSENCAWLTQESMFMLLSKAGFESISLESIPINWEFENKSQLQDVANTVFGVDYMILDRYGLVNDLKITLPFLFAMGVKS